MRAYLYFIFLIVLLGCNNKTEIKIDLKDKTGWFFVLFIEEEPFKIKTFTPDSLKKEEESLRIKTYTPDSLNVVYVSDKLDSTKYLFQIYSNDDNISDQVKFLGRVTGSGIVVMKFYRPSENEELPNQLRTNPGNHTDSVIWEGDDKMFYVDSIYQSLYEEKWRIFEKERQEFFHPSTPKETSTSN